MAFSDPIVAGESLIRTGIKSPDFVTGVQGWRIAKDGSAEFNDALIRGEYRTAISGDRIIINPGDALFENVIRFITTATQYAEIAGVAFNGTEPLLALYCQQPSGVLPNGCRFLLRTSALALDYADHTLGFSTSILELQRNYMVYASRIHYHWASQQDGTGESLHLIGHKGTNGAEIFTGRIEARLKSNTEPFTVAPSPSIGIVWGQNAGIGRLYVVASDGNTYRSIAASAFVVSSSITRKRNIRDLDRSALQIVRNAPIKEWEYIPTPEHTEIFTDENQVEQTRIVPAENPIRHVGPMAEDLPANITQPGRDGLEVDLRDMIGMLWGAVRELSDRVQQLDTKIRELSTP